MFTGLPDQRLEEGRQLRGERWEEWEALGMVKEREGVAVVLMVGRREGRKAGKANVQIRAKGMSPV